MSLEYVPLRVREGDTGVYGDIENWIIEYIETGRHAVDFAIIQQRNLAEVDAWVRDKTN